MALYSLQEAPSPLIIAQLCLSAGTTMAHGAWRSHGEDQVGGTVLQRRYLQGDDAT